MAAAAAAPSTAVTPGRHKWLALDAPSYVEKKEAVVSFPVFSAATHAQGGGGELNPAPWDRAGMTSVSASCLSPLRGALLLVPTLNSGSEKSDVWLGLEVSSGLLAWPA